MADEEVVNEAEAEAQTETGAEADEVQGNAQESAGAEERASGAEETVTTDWRDAIKNADARKMAQDSADVEHLAIRALEMRQKLSKSVVVPGKGAAEEEIAAFRKAMGVPDDVAGYEFPPLPDGADEDAANAQRAEWASTFHELNLPKATAATLIDKFQQYTDKITAEQQRLDKEYADQATADLKAEWGADYQTNVNLANLAVSKVMGDDYEEIRHLEGKDGKFLMDNPLMIKAMARLGREMNTGNLGPVTDENARQTILEQAQELRGKANEAAARGDRVAANRYSEQERQLYERMDGDENIVGVGTRVA